jgi:hypothetical protein
VSLARSPASLLATSRGMQQPSGPSHDTTQSNKPSILSAVYIYSGRASSSAIHTGVYFPATHSAQVPPSGPAEPALQVQLVTAELPAGDVASVGQAMHERADDSLEYLPAEQGMHVVDPGLELSEICNDSVEVSEICNHTSR